MIEIKHQFPGTNEVHLVLKRTTETPVIWRPLSGYVGEGCVWYEIVAARLDRLLQTNLIPWAWEETHEGVRGVMQQFIDGVDGYAWTDVDRVKVKGSMAYHQLMVFDYILGNKDRHDWHVIWNKASQIWGIDNTNIFHMTGDTAPLNAASEDIAACCHRVLATEDMMESFTREILRNGYATQEVLDGIKLRMEGVCSSAL